MTRGAAISVVLVALSTAVCHKSSPTEPGPIGHIPIEAGDGWSVSAAEAQGLDAARLDAVYRSAAGLGNILGLVVARNGFLVGERYFNEGGNVPSRSIGRYRKKLAIPSTDAGRSI